MVSSRKKISLLSAESIILLYNSSLNFPALTSQVALNPVGKLSDYVFAESFFDP